jgi:hypothetical protein
LIQTAPVNFEEKREEPIFLSPFSLNWLTDVNWYSDRVFQKFGAQPEGMAVELLDHRVEQGGDAWVPSVLFGQRTLNPLMEMYGKVDFLNCHAELAEVKDVNDFMSGLRLFLKPSGVAILDFLHLSPNILARDFLGTCRDPIKHYSFTTVSKLLNQFEMQVFDVVPCEPEGSLRISVKHISDESRRITTRVQVMFGAERDAGMSSLDYYEGLWVSFQTLHSHC